MLKYRSDIDGLRAIAVLLVVIFHAAPSVIPGGFIGVDIFFVISGFLITQIIWEALEDGLFSIGWFYARRAKRIFPALFLVLAAVLIAGWFTLLPDEYKRLGKHVAGGAAFVSNLLSWREVGYFEAAAETQQLLHLWSLGIEEQFYIVWPLTLFLLHRSRIAIFPALLTVIVLSFGLNVYQVVHAPVADFYSPFTRFWELALGGLLACHGWARRPNTPAWSNDVKAWLGIALIAGSAAMLHQASRFPGWWALLPTWGAALLIWAGPRAWLSRTLLSSRPMVWIGLISYPLYLWHWPLLVYARIVETGDPSALLRFSIVVLSIVLAWMTYRYVERPIRFGLVKRHRLKLVCAPLVLAFAAGSLVYANQGYPSRFPGEIKALANFKYDTTIPYRMGTCFLTRNQPVTGLKECSDGSADAGKTLLLWGDSYAAALYPGFKHSVPRETRLLQITAVGCPPAIAIPGSGKRCQDITDAVMRRIDDNQVKHVVIMARWSAQGWPVIAPYVSAAIVELRRHGVTRIDLVGQLPEWSKTLPVTLLQAYQSEKRFHQRTKAGLVSGSDEIDRSLEKFAAARGVNFVSARNIFCNEEGCLTMIGGRLDALTSFDYGHLTVPASEFLVERFPAEVRQ